MSSRYIKCNGVFRGLDSESRHDGVARPAIAPQRAAIGGCRVAVREDQIRGTGVTAVEDIRRIATADITAAANQIGLALVVTVVPAVGQEGAL